MAQYTVVDLLVHTPKINQIIHMPQIKYLAPTCISSYTLEMCFSVHFNSYTLIFYIFLYQIKMQENN